MLVLLATAGCGAPPRDLEVEAPAPEEGPLWDKTFLLDEAIVDGDPHTLVDGTEVSLRFTDDKRLVANAGCNTMSGPVSLDDGTLTVDHLSITNIGCDPPRHEQDAWLSKFLDGEPSWELLDGPRLVLRGGDTELVLTDRAVADPARALVGTVWTVDTLVDGEVASSTPAGAPPATVTFEKDRVDVFAGCNSGSANYRSSDDTITIDALVLTRKACEPGIMRLESAVTGVLDGTITYEIESDVLRLDHPSGKGLRLRAE